MDTKRAQASAGSAEEWAIDVQAAESRDEDGPVVQPGAAAGQGSWFWLCVGSWCVMFGALAASAPLISDPIYLFSVGLVLVIAFPAAYYLHFSGVSRRAVNWTAFGMAVGLGAVAMALHWPREGVHAVYGIGFPTLVKVFLWVMAFRAFTMRALIDLVLSVIPAASCVILVLVIPPSALALTGTAAVTFGALYLLAAEQTVRVASSGERARRVGKVVWERGPRRGAPVNTWQMVAVVVVVVAVIAGVAASYLRLSRNIGWGLRERLARRLAQYLVTDRLDCSPELVVILSGASPPAGDRVLFVVECDRGENWRQQAYVTYTGYSWAQGPGGKARARQKNGAWHIDTQEVSGVRRDDGVKVEQTFNLQAPFGGALPGLFVATRFKGEAMSIRMGEEGVIACSGYVASGESYQVTSMLPSQWPAPRDDPLPPLDQDIREKYLQLPEDFPPRIRSLAAVATRGADDAYERAVMIQSYLPNNYTYDLHPPPRPYDRDFVEHFLFDSMSGYCNHFASAMVVMCRALGLPARFVTGFVPGEYDPENESYEVRTNDAHSWVEVYIEGRGWQSFDPTPPLGVEGEGGVAGLWDSLAAMAASVRLGVASLALGIRGPAPVLAVALVCLLSAAGLGRRRRHRQTRFRGRAASPNRRALFAYAQMLRWLSGLGMGRRDTDPPLHHVAALPASARPVLAQVQQITAAYLRARYGRSGISEADALEAEEALRRLSSALFRERALKR